jgi:hypothetical protein
VGVSHETIYNLLEDIPSKPTVSGSSMLLMGVGGGAQEAPLFTELGGCCPTSSMPNTSSRRFNTNAGGFVTTDKRTILRFASQLEAMFGIKLHAVTAVDGDRLEPGIVGQPRGNRTPTSSRKASRRTGGFRHESRTAASSRNARGELLISRLKVRVLHGPSRSALRRFEC